MKSQSDFEHERERECIDSGVTAIWQVGRPKGGPDNRLLVQGRIEFPGVEGFYAETTEIIRMDSSSIKRQKYGYYLVCTDGALDFSEIGGFERDEAHGEHKHCGIHIAGGEPFGAISFKDAVAEAWIVIKRVLDGESDHCPPGD